jgi:hypothetical protein
MNNNNIKDTQLCTVSAIGMLMAAFPSGVMVNVAVLRPAVAPSSKRRKQEQTSE